MEKIFALLQRQVWLGPIILTALLIFGVVFGVLIGWVVWPVSYQPGPDDVLAVADSFSLNNDAALAKARLQNLSKADQARILSDLITQSKAKNLTLQADRLNALAQVLGVPVTLGAPGASTNPAPSSGLNLASITRVLIPVVLIVVLGALMAGVAVFVLRRYRPALQARSRATVTTMEPDADDVEAPPAPAPGGLGRFIASYILGNDHYDVSFPLETARQEFLGECGLGVSETLGEGMPEKVAAFDLWLFDKGDVRTETRIVMSEFAFNDPGIRSKLAAKGEAVLAAKGKPISLETQSLRVQAQVVELVYAANPNFQPESHFQKLIVEIVGFQKQSG